MYVMRPNKQKEELSDNDNGDFNHGNKDSSNMNSVEGNRKSKKHISILSMKTEIMYGSAEISKTIVSRQAEVNRDEFEAELRAHASTENIIILALVDSFFLDMTFNFYETSILKYNISNYLFIASDYRACGILLSQNINCFVYITTNYTRASTLFGSYGFAQKMNIRILFILDALKLGFTVLHTDVDVVFMNNPLYDLSSSIHGDIACLLDDMQYNAGFIYLRPTELAITVYTEMRSIVSERTVDDQIALNEVIPSLIEKHKAYKVRIEMLNMTKYQYGRNYFELGHRYFADRAPCPQCIVVHNNWIISKEAKRYRFREVLLWSYDDNGYYSNTSTKYLMYSNVPYNLTINIDYSNVELDTLKTALYFGHVLNRVVILPRFHLTETKVSTWTEKERPLNNWIRMSCFDNQFYEKYRENSFLHHPKVPPEIKQDITPPFWIQTKQSISMLGRKPTDVTLLTPCDEKKVSTEEIVDWFRGEKSSVLNFHSLYGIFNADMIQTIAESTVFSRQLLLAFHATDYKQVKHLKKSSCYIDVQ